MRTAPALGTVICQSITMKPYYRILLKKNSVFSSLAHPYKLITPYFFIPLPQGDNSLF